MAHREGTLPRGQSLREARSTNSELIPNKNLRSIEATLNRRIHLSRQGPRAAAVITVQHTALLHHFITNNLSLLLHILSSRAL